MKRLALLAALITAFTPLPLLAQTERIRLFDSYITVNADGSMVVHETIEVEAAGRQIRHGIYRDFPTTYHDQFGNQYRVGFQIVAVERDGRPEPYHLGPIDKGVRVYFGDSNFTLSRGTYTYAFTYVTNRQLGFFADHDELYWNVTGNGWRFPIDVATATVVLPEAVRGADIGLTGYTGFRGERARSLTWKRDAQNNPQFRAEELSVGQGLTIVVSWPKGLILPPSTLQSLNWFVSDNLAVAVGLGGLALIFLYYVVVWSMVGRDPEQGSIVPLYEPPDNMSPAAMRYLERMDFDNQAFTASIIDLAAKGYLTIDRDASLTYRLIRKPSFAEADKALSPDERVLAKMLFEDGGTVYLDRQNYALLQRSRKALQLSLRTSMERIDFVTNSQYMWPGVLLTLATVGAVVLVGHNFGALAALFMTVWLTFWTLGVYGMLTAVFKAWKATISGNPVAGAGAIVLTLFIIPFLAGECFGVFMLYQSAGLGMFVVIISALGTNILFHQLLKARTQAGRALLDRIEGFRMFLSAVDSDRINVMNPTNQTPAVFERFLPFALALGVEHAWAEKFSQVLASAGAGGDGARYSPSWYTGGISSFSPADFTSSFSESFSTAVSSSSAPASSSGSGGGGSSGGGGGGGGGGGW